MDSLSATRTPIACMLLPGGDSNLLTRCDGRTLAGFVRVANTLLDCVLPFFFSFKLYRYQITNKSENCTYANPGNYIYIEAIQCNKRNNCPRKRDVVK